MKIDLKKHLSDVYVDYTGQSSMGVHVGYTWSTRSTGGAAVDVDSMDSNIGLAGISNQMVENIGIIVQYWK